MRQVDFPEGRPNDLVSVVDRKSSEEDRLNSAVGKEGELMRDASGLRQLGELSLKAPFDLADERDLGLREHVRDPRVGDAGGDVRVVDAGAGSGCACRAEPMQQQRLERLWVTYIAGRGRRYLRGRFDQLGCADSDEFLFGSKVMLHAPR